ncbi:MAG: tRNA preQ1(34) S-adenosylmethionine ribosyltransferase-isomerase QueA [Rickettsiaceae bacterium]|nr:tRNA preQ1(34) S-adenosylmethionine ribosyltransferase-isomerase QueA [Rickettsiaceae bacterium]MDP4833030.1 tRNA preQ1(34) S-adenosylmethionine ribosyltransferase-isomerase QueA [Rickettsiaceae bacterium]MDP5020617.1 tRNA preQ1(34) S-adenosylmethionine ribosyltransferase-isomerase QueA [Rickettsiaceae bacterium]MDP5083038.1 tRNA preQ1(34) S-adenosylmethionine ribosyltransferase-isomerase QueA [Rickettsiaceae bacterium]
MQLSDFDFELPVELIAQSPASQRDHSNLLIPDSLGNQIVKFYNLLDHLKEGDLLIFNDSRVVNAKLTLNAGERKINVNLNKPSGANSWLGFAKPAKKLKEGDEFVFDSHKIVIKKKLEAGEIEIEFQTDNISIFDFLDKYGQVPLPQYIKRPENNFEDIERYQNVYSRAKGSVAAATAGLHFSEKLLQKIRAKGVETVFVTLHVGAGTFLPVKTENIHEHKMHSEWCEVSKEAAMAINAAKKANRRVIVVGTTAMRTLESCSRDNVVYPAFMDTNIFITPGYKFQIADILITNFHLPKSTLFMLICAFAGHAEMQTLYKYAIDNKMRFFSYGDAMMIDRKV